MDIRAKAATAVRAKADGSPVTAADEAAEHIILEALTHLTPEYPVIAEERMAQGFVPAIDLATTPFWLVDPLDGTRAFVEGKDDFAVNIALVAQGRPVLGVIHAPARDALYYGHHGKAFLEMARSAPRPIEARTVPSEGLTVISSHHHGSKGAGDLVRLQSQRVHQHLTMSSALKFCLIAAGEADLYPRLGTTMEWDTAAGEALLVAAGGHVTTPDGQPLAYGKPGFKQNHFVAQGKKSD